MPHETMGTAFPCAMYLDLARTGLISSIMSIPILYRYLWGSVIKGYVPVLLILMAVF